MYKEKTWLRLGPYITRNYPRYEWMPVNGYSVGAIHEFPLRK